MVVNSVVEVRLILLIARDQCHSATDWRNCWHVTPCTVQYQSIEHQWDRWSQREMALPLTDNTSVKWWLDEMPFRTVIIAAQFQQLQQQQVASSVNCLSTNSD